MYVFIPVEMCSWAFKNRFVRPFQVYIYLKAHCNGKMKINKVDLYDIAQELELKSGRAIKNNIDLLLEKNWIGYNNNSGYYFIRSFDRIRADNGFKSRTAAEFNSDRILSFKGFIAGAVIGYMINIQRRKKRVTERNRSRSSPITRPTSEYFPVASLALAKVLNVSISTAFKLKQLAAREGYILLRHNLKKINVPVSQKEALKRAFPEVANRVVVVNGRLAVQLPDTVLQCVRFKRRKKIKTYIGRIAGSGATQVGVDKGRERPLIETTVTRK